MVQQKEDRTPDHLTPAEIIALADQLASDVSYPEQRKDLQDFLEKHFGGESYIWLKSPPKSLLPTLPPIDLPFNPFDLAGEKLDACDRSQVIKADNNYWTVISLTREAEAFGKIILKRVEPLSERMLEVLCDISKVAGLAIYATLQAHLQNWRQKQLALVRNVTAQISQITEVDTLTREITDLIRQTFNYYYVAIFIIHQETGRLHFKASASVDPGERPEFENEDHPGFVMGEHIIGFVAQTGRELIANDVRKEPRYQAVDTLDKTKSEVVIPLKIEGRILGVFDVQSNVKNAFDEDDLLVLRALADNIALAIESTHLYQGLQLRADQLATVSEVSRAITFILDINELLQKIVDLIHDRFHFPFVHLYTVDPVHDKITFRAGSGPRTAIYEEMGVSYPLDSVEGILPWVIQHGQTKRVNDVEKEPLFRASPYEGESIGSEMAVPLYFGGEILGVLDIQSLHKDAFSWEDQQLMQTLADNIAIAIRNARLYNTEKWRRQVAESLRDVAGLLSENIALNDVLNSILTQLHKNLPCDIAGIWLFDSHTTDDPTPLETRELHLAAYKTTDSYSPEALGKVSFYPDAWVKNALTKKEPKIRSQTDPKGPIATFFKLEDNYSAIAAPLSTGEEILGMLTLTHHSPNRYGTESQNITSAFASYAAIAIKNARLYETSQEQAWISTILLEVAQAIQSLTDLQELASTIVRLTPMVVGVKGCGLILQEPESNLFQLYAAYGIGDSRQEYDIEQPLMLGEIPIMKELVLKQEPQIVGNASEELNLPDDLTAEMKQSTLFLMPMSARNEYLGAFLLANEPNNMPNNDQYLLLSKERSKIIQGIIQQTTIAVENIRLIESRQEEAYISTVLLQAAQTVVSSTDLADTLDKLVNIMPILVGIDSGIIYLYDNEEKLFSVSSATTINDTDEEDLVGLSYQPGEFPILDTIHKLNRPLVHPLIEASLSPEDWDLALPDEGQVDPIPLLQSRYPLLMGFPLSVQDEVFGVLLAKDENISTNRERRFELLWGIAQQASLAIQNDIVNQEMVERQRLEREFQLAREIQQTFLPDHIPQIPGWLIDARWETARQVGGDFYDYFYLPDGRMAFVIADVSDKGLGASLYMTVTRTLLRAVAPESGSPAETLERVNDLLISNSQNGLFVTTFYGLLDLDNGLLTYTIAGHNPPMILRNEENAVKELQKGGVALGVLPDISLNDFLEELKPGDCLVLYTDGVTEAFNLQDQMYGDARLIQVLADTIGKSAVMVLQALENDLKSFRGLAPASDDTTMLAICREQSLADKNRDTRST